MKNKTFIFLYNSSAYEDLPYKRKVWIY